VPETLTDQQRHAHARVTRQGIATTAAALQELLGQRLVAVIAGVKDAKAVGRWASGERFGQVLMPAWREVRRRPGKDTEPCGRQRTCLLDGRRQDRAAGAFGDAAMELGEVSESVTVSGRGQAVPAPASATTVRSPQRIPIGGNVQAARLLVQPRAEYPAELQQQGITGTVMLKAVVGKDGRLLNPQVVNTEIHPALAQAALEAVRKWQYQPTLLNGQPVETLTSIDIRFELDK